jgi:hypothetical protein
MTVNKKTNRIGAVQGDVPLLRIEARTPGGKVTKERIVALGEVTGHDHRIVGNCEVYDVEREIGWRLFPGKEVKVADGSSVYLVHNSGPVPEHTKIQIMPGLTFIPAPGHQQVEYWFEEERAVAD